MINLVIIFNDEINYTKGKMFFGTKSSFSIFDINDKMRKIYFSVEDEDDADCTDYYISQELSSTNIENYSFEIEH